MNTFFRLLLLFDVTLVFSLVSCSSSPQNHKIPVLSKTSTLYFETYNMPTYTTNKLLVVIDPHGDGKLAYHQFSSLVDSFSLHVIGLNHVQNNDRFFLEHIQAAIHEYCQFQKLESPELYLAGFSGGARMALQYALAYQAKGIIMCGAGLPKVDETSLPLRMAFVCGLQDFNFIETFYMPDSKASQNENMIGIYFNGKHEWPPTNELHAALAFVLNNREQAIYYKHINPNSISCEDYILLNKKYEFAKKMHISAELYKASYIPYIDKCYSLLSEQLNEEQTRNMQLVEQLQSERSKDIIQQIDQYLQRSQNTADVLTSASYARTLAYLGVVMYSFTSQSLHTARNPQTAIFLDIYKKLEPGNPDMLFFKAVYNLQQHNFDTCRITLQKAIENGWTDTQKIKQQFPESIWKDVIP